MSDIKHSPLPFTATGMVSDFWLHDATGEYLTSGYDCIFNKENADFIIRACNSHYGLIEALEKLLEVSEHELREDRHKEVWETCQAILFNAQGEPND